MNDNRLDHVPLVDEDGCPLSGTLEVFLSPSHRGQRDLFQIIKWGRSHEVIDAYVLAALEVVTSRSVEYESKVSALTSLVEFVRLGDEGIGEWNTRARDELGESYYRVHRELASEFRTGAGGADWLHSVFKALATTDFFRVKRTMMMGIVIYDYPENARWLLERLRVVGRGLSVPDGEIAWYCLSFLTHSFRNVARVLDKPDTTEIEKVELSDAIDLIEMQIPTCLTCSDWRVVKEAITYCELADVADNREILEQLAFSENEAISDTAKHALESI